MSLLFAHLNTKEPISYFIKIISFFLDYLGKIFVCTQYWYFVVKHISTCHKIVNNACCCVFYFVDVAKLFTRVSSSNACKLFLIIELKYCHWFHAVTLNLNVDKYFYLFFISSNRWFQVFLYCSLLNRTLRFRILVMPTSILPISYRIYFFKGQRLLRIFMKAQYSFGLGVLFNNFSFFLFTICPG